MRSIFLWGGKILIFPTGFQLGEKTISFLDGD
jgi:hypothetical protein